MIIAIIIAVLIAILLAIYVFITKNLFNFAIVRHDTKKEITKEWLDRHGFSGYEDEIIEARNEFLAADFEKVEIKSYDGLTLRGLLCNTPNSKGTIILFHGYRSTPDIDFCVAKKFYARLGLNVLLPYQRAHGESEGNYITFGVRERYDVHSWVEFINKMVGYQLPIFLSGLSMGSSTVLMSTEKPFPDNVKLIIADCGFTSPYSIFKHVVKSTMKIPFSLFIPLFNFMCKKKAGFSVYEYSTIKALKNCKIPIFFIHGDSDNFVPPYMTDENYGACTSEKYILKVKNAPHAASFMYDSGEYKKTLETLISKYL